MQERLQKILSRAGVASRREAETIIVSGRVAVNGAVVTELGTKADAGKDRITLDGKPVRAKLERVYLLLFKPAGYVTTLKDPEGRPVITDLLKGLGSGSIRWDVSITTRKDSCFLPMTASGQTGWPIPAMKWRRNIS